MSPENKQPDEHEEKITELEYFKAFTHSRPDPDTDPPTEAPTSQAETQASTSSGDELTTEADTEDS